MKASPEREEGYASHCRSLNRGDIKSRIMLVDDEPDIRATVGAVLEPLEFEVYKAESGQKCIEELESGFRGVILMDIMMPEMDGWTTIREIEAKGLMEGNIVFMLTAKEIPDEDLAELTETVLNYVRKPFKGDYLVSIVEKYSTWLEQIQKAHVAGN